MSNKSPGHGFLLGHPKFGGAKKGSKHHPPTVWVLDSLKQRGFDFEQELVDALNEAKSVDGGIRARALELLDRLIKLIPHIANRPKETVSLEGIETLVIKEYAEGSPDGTHANPSHGE